MVDVEAVEIVVVEDEANLRELLGDVLSLRFGTVSCCESIVAAQAKLEQREPDLLLLDVKLPDGDGLELLSRLRARGFRAPVIVMTAFGTIDRAVSALKLGASDFLVKPFDNERLVSSVAAALESQRRIEELELAAGTVEDRSETSKEIIGAGGGLRDVVLLLPRIAASDATVLIRGESGTGKELVARALHGLSPRMDGTFVSLNCAAIAPSLLESELFGFERGTFTGAHAQRKGYVETADGGTLFLDEIGDMSLEAQTRLLRVLQEREITRVGGRNPIEVDVRVIAATHQPLEALVSAGRFRQDLLYRLDVVPIQLPALRERPQDIAGLVQHFIDKCAKKLRQKAPPPPGREVISALERHDWPGNVRELENFVERSIVLGRFDIDSLLPARVSLAPAPMRAPTPAPVEGRAEAEAEVRPLKEVVREAERRAVVAALRAAQGNKAQAARLLGVSYKTLFNKINEHDIKEAVHID